MKDKKDRHENPSEQDFIAQNESDECSQNGDATQGESANSDESEQKDALFARKFILYARFEPKHKALL